jgi:hypothetical protein
VGAKNSLTLPPESSSRYGLRCLLRVAATLRAVLTQLGCSRTGVAVTLRVTADTTGRCRPCGAVGLWGPRPAGCGLRPAWGRGLRVRCGWGSPTATGRGGGRGHRAGGACAAGDRHPTGCGHSIGRGYATGRGHPTGRGYPPTVATPPAVATQRFPIRGRAIGLRFWWSECCSLPCARGCRR